MAFVISETNHTEAWLLALEHSNPACTQRFWSFGSKPARRQAPALVGSSKWRIEVDDLKVGDIVKWRTPFGRPVYRGTIVKINGEEATVLWFDTGWRLTDSKDNLIKVEERGT